MEIKLYDKKIFAPNKCGTRYLENIYDYELFSHMFLPKLDNDCFFIVREPIEHLKSALLTQLIHHRGKDYFYELFSKFFKNGESDAMHFSNILYKKIYFYKVRNKNCNIVHLRDLSNLLQRFGHKIEYDKKKYDHSSELDNWIDKHQFYDEIKQNYPNEIKLLEEWIDIENIYYNKLFEDDFNDISIL